MISDIHYYNRVTMALNDLISCRKYASKMLKLPIGKPFTDERTIYESLFVALIVSYGRVFKSSNTTKAEFKDIVSNSFGEFRAKVLRDLNENNRKLNFSIINKRDTAIAHSDASSRNYQPSNNSQLCFGRNPYYPYDHQDVERILKLVEILICEVGAKQTEISKKTFKNTLF